MSTYHPDLIERAVPRYTSYPTAAEFGDAIGPADLSDALRSIAPGARLSLYVHIPYCTEICWYCGCNTGAANKRSRLDAYLEALEAEIDLVAGMLPVDIDVAHVAFGGGSPNALQPLQFARLVDRVLTRFRAVRPALSVEVDPRHFDPVWGHVLRSAGFDRASLGVQTLDPKVQQAIGRVQPAAMIAAVTDTLRDAGIRSLGYDLMYGLPHQGLLELEETLHDATALGPDRLSVFGYAHLPEMLPRQRRIDAAALPSPRARFEQAMAARRRLMDAGYAPIGFDHFARPGDVLDVAMRAGRLRRNFQGYTDDDCDILIGLGASAISRLPGLYAQNEKLAGRYRMRVGAGQLATQRGIARTADSIRRGRIIEQLLCEGAVQLPADLAGRLGGHISAFTARGLAHLDGDTLRLDETGWPYARLIASGFDAYRSTSHGGFSQAS